MMLTARTAFSAALVLLTASACFGADGGEGGGPIPGAAAGAPFPASPSPMGMPPMSGAAGLPPMSGGIPSPMATPAPFGVTGTTPPPADISAPPPLSSLAPGFMDAGTTATTASLAAGPIELYEFLYREDEEMGVVRERYTLEEARQRKEQEIARLIAKYGSPQQPQVIGAPQQPGQQGVDPRAAAEWDFYFEQLQLYSEYVRDKVIRAEENSDFPMPTYDSAGPLNEAYRELWDRYQLLAAEAGTEQFNENREFYERLESREDRRRNFLIWLSEQERALQQKSDIWARQINGDTWTDGQPLSRDDWYYGTHFNAANPVEENIGGQAFLFSREPQNHVPSSTLNVLSTNLTPYDVVDHHGNLKSPAVERARGTIVRPPPPQMQQAAPGGSVEMAPTDNGNGLSVAPMDDALPQ